MFNLRSPLAHHVVNAQILAQLEKNAIEIEALTYRWVHPNFPLPPGGPEDGDCATAGSYIFGQHMNAKGHHGMLYTALSPETAAVEVLSPEHGLTPEAAETSAVNGLAKEGYLLYEIDVKLHKVIDLRANGSLLKVLHNTPANTRRSCQEPPPPHTVGEQIGWFALKEGFDGILRPSSAYQRRWGDKAAAEALVLDILCPNLRNDLRWKRIE